RLGVVSEQIASQRPDEDGQAGDGQDERQEQDCDGVHSNVSQTVERGGPTLNARGKTNRAGNGLSASDAIPLWPTTRPTTCRNPITGIYYASLKRYGRQ